MEKIFKNSLYNLSSKGYIVMIHAAIYLLVDKVCVKDYIIWKVKISDYSTLEIGFLDRSEFSEIK
jgi:hypothetical protein